MRCNFLKHKPKLIIFGIHNLQTFKHNALVDELLLMQFYFINIRPKLHHRKWRKLRVTQPVNMTTVPNFLNLTSSLLMLFFLQPLIQILSVLSYRIADRTASQHLWGSRDVIGHVTIWFPVGHLILVVLWTKPLSLTVSDIFNVECDVMDPLTYVTLIRRLSAIRYDRRV